MKFIITRSSGCKKKPCEGARKEKVVSHDYRTVKTLDEAKKKHWGEQWFADGSNHREEDGMVVRDIEREMWIIEIDDIMEFINQNGESIIFPQHGYSRPVIEIYDSYRE